MNNPYNSFLFQIPGKRGTYNIKEVQNMKNVMKEDKILDVIDIKYNKRLGSMAASIAMLKFI